ncbi:MAG: hypothetical protein HOP28_01035 [Gemmatimonadales bacterium]|nr:hypothetical protein [Gemmatimonadales bacterium]
MPVTAKLSRAFYERLGDDVANELVDWFNQVDLAYRTDLRELNELNFARFDAKMGERLAELRADLREELIKELDRRFGGLEPRFEAIDARFAAIDGRLAGLQLEIERRTLSLRVDLANFRGDILKWMFAFWAPTVLALIGLFLKR